MNRIIIKTEDKRMRLLEEINNLGSEVLYIWGNGSYSRDIEKYLRTVGNYKGQIRFIVDDAYYESEQLESIPASELFGSGRVVNVPIVFGFYNYPVILKKREEHSELKHFYDFHFTIVNGKRLIWNAEKARLREQEYLRTYELFSDEQSRRTMQLYLNAATAGEFHELFTECYEQIAYFNRMTKKLKIDTLIDCGAFDGDSIHDFIKVFPDYKCIVAVEPDVSNVEKLTQRQKNENIHDLTVVNKGLGPHEGILHFRANGKSNSFLSDDGDVQVQITTLDKISKELTGKIFVKMDIEGSEFDALRGGEQLIRDKHPALAICVYHKEEDLITIPQYVHRIVGEGVYDYYLGFHGLDLAELVFYAIPKNQ